MNQYLSKHFKTNSERIDYHVYGGTEFQARARFIIGLDGMFCEEAMIMAQSDFEPYTLP